MAERAHLSIGETLTLLREEFPDITISKIRFLESQGLVDPERTPSGYRKFFPHDIERLRWVLRQQREHFLPLRVIKGRLSEVEAGLASGATGPTDGAPPTADGAALPDGQAGGAAGEPGSAEQPGAEPSERATYSLEELAAALGVGPAALEDLVSYGLLVPGGAAGDTAYYGPEALPVARAALGFARHGVEARHLRAWRNAADREAILFEQLLAPLLRQRSPVARQQATMALRQLEALGGELRAALVRQALRDLRN